MKTKTSEKASSWIRLGTLNNVEFLSGIKKAEDGKFITVQESMLNFEKWLKSRKKQ